MSKNFKLNNAGVRELLKSKGMQSLISEKTSAIRSRCGDGYSQDVRVGKNRIHSIVFAETAKAKKENSENNTILKAVR